MSGCSGDDRVIMRAQILAFIVSSVLAGCGTSETQVEVAAATTSIETGSAGGTQILSPDSSCADVATNRQTDSRYSGSDEPTQQQVYKIVLDECTQWRARVSSSSSPVMARVR